MNLDSVLYQDNDEANGLASRFDLPEPMPVEEEIDPLSVSTVGVDTESDMGFLEFQTEFAKALAEIPRGGVKGALDLGQDAEMFGRAIYAGFNPQEGESFFDGFMRGLEQETVVPGADRMAQAVGLEEFPHVSEKEGVQTMMSGLGEIAGLGGAGAGIVKGGKAVAKAMKGAEAVEPVTTYTTPSQVAEFASMKLGGKGLKPMSVEGTLHKYVREVAGEPVTKSKALCHSQACQAAFTDAAPGDKLVMLRTPKGDSIAHSILIDKNGKLKFDNMDGKWDSKTRTWEGTPMKLRKPQPMVSAEEYDVSLIRDAAEVYKQNKLMIFNKNEAK